MKLYAIHEIHRRPDPKGEVEVVPAGGVFTGSEAELKDLADNGAARKATKVDEAAWQERQETQARQAMEIDPLAISPDAGASAGAVDGLDDLTKAQLHELGKSNNVALETDANKATLIEKLRAAGVSASASSDAPTD